MDDEKYNEQFDELTADLSAERTLGQIADRAETTRMITLHAAGIYRQSRKAGLPRKFSLQIAQTFWTSEMALITVLVIDDEGL
ncbi:hypothetical protein ABZ154_09090 [Streptomyces sp. NPDC006261]|uniref:hypothetical protein n=1 Tax=Streptomyces sp. NPDC006261 TaxID=3156739 RepID=UPI0033BDC551